MKASRPARLVVIGSSNTDLVVNCAHLPQPGETVAGGEFARHAGGKGANQAVAAARAGAAVTFVGRCGRDEFGRAAKAGLRREGIRVTHFRVTEDAPSGIALILVGGRDRENIIAVARSANDLLSAADVQAAEKEIAHADAVIAQLEVQLAAVEEAATIAERHGVPFILNPAPARKLSAHLLRMVTVLTPNSSEVELLTGRSDPEAAASELLRRGCKQVVVTLGAKGALIVDASGVRRMPAPRVRPLDTVGAGDCFTAWLAVGLAQGLDIDAAAGCAIRAAALAITRPGAQAGMPLAGEVARLNAGASSRETVSKACPLR